MAQSSRSVSSTAEVTVDTHPTMYLNILVLKRPEKEPFSEAVTARVNERLPESFGHGLLRSLAAKAAGRVVSAAVTKDAIASKLAKKMPTIIPAKLSAMGVHATARDVFRLGSFVVVKVAVQHVDLGKIVGMNVGQREGENVDACLSCLHGVASCFGYGEAFNQSVDDTTGRKLVKRLCEVLPEELPKRMAEKGVIVDVVAKGEAEQAAYFFDILEVLQDNKELKELQSGEQA